MTSPEANISAQQSSVCPLCRASLNPEGTACTKCDWVPGYSEKNRSGFHSRDLIATLLSLVPGLGHIYKGHKKVGICYLIGTALAICAVAVAATFTAGWATPLLLLYWAWVMLLAYLIEDRSLPPKQHDY